MENNFPVIILVAPQLGENIGACARAMKNFGLHEIRIVNPRDGWPNPKAVSSAVGASDLILRAKIFNNLNDAISDLEYLYATTSVKRDMNKNHILSKNITNHFQKNLRVGILFGRENWGLNNEEISLANEIITIDTNPAFSSLNIAQSVLVICYELFKQIDRPDLTNNQLLATKEDIEFFQNHLTERLYNKGFFKVKEKENLLKQKILNILTRIDKLSRHEIQILMGILKTLDQ
ncbi:MAG: RNA methyltransferase [Rickettsiaceae bacterium]|nr:RNA methyltransferase [Rickettsiaceae bacterium]